MAAFWMAAPQMTTSWMAASQMTVSWMAAFAFQYLQNSLRRNWMLRQCLLFAYWLSKHPVFWFTSLFNTVSQATFGYPFTVQQLYYLRDIMSRQRSRALSTYPLPRMLGFERAFFTLKPFLPYISSCCFQDLPGTGSSPSKVAGLHADHRNIALARLLF